MARKSVIKISYINNFFCNENKLIEKGENAVESGHIASFCFDADSQFVKGSVLASMKDKSYTVEIQLKEDGDIQKAKCECPRGLVKCHHMAALLLHAHYNISVTDKQCAWSKKTTKNKEQAVKSVMDLFPPKKFRAIKEMPDNLPEETFQLLQKHQAAVGFTWLLNPVVEVTNDSPIIVTPRDILLSKEYENSLNKEEFLKDKLKVTDAERNLVTEKTKGQSGNFQWSVLRKDRITSSNFGSVLSASKRNRFPPSLFKTLLNTYNLDGVKAIQWGRSHEMDAATDFQAKTNLVTEITGLWLHECGYLGTSPDRIVHLPDGSFGIVEIKCPFKFRNDLLSEALKNERKYVVTIMNDNYVLDKEHSIYHQIQGQLHIANCQRGFLVIWTLKESLIFEIQKDDSWADNFYILSNFYFKNFIPHISANL